MLFVRQKRRTGSAGAAPHLRWGIPKQKREIRTCGRSLRQSVP
nr:MAG TPA: hypothetical protein [Caudoviricetes sp.]